MAATKKVGSFDEVRIDGVNVSDLFDSFGLESTDEEIPAPSFNADGYEETLTGSRKQAFVGRAYYTTESYALLFPLYSDRTVFEVGWQPDGLRDPTRETYVGNVRLTTFSPRSEFGQPQRWDVRLVAADNNGITPVTGS